MKITLARTGVLTILCVLFSFNTPASDTNQATALVTGNNALALGLYHQLKSGDGNLFFSPYSISMCLGMTYAGAQGDTARQMAGTLNFSSSPAQLPSLFAALQSEINSVRSKDIELKIANGLWAQKNHPFQVAFLDTVCQQFQASVEQVDFRTQAEPTRLKINDWVGNQTKGKITDLLPPGVIDGATRLVLVNAIYFKSRWTHPFEAKNTAVDSFFVTADKKVSAPFMHAETRYGYAELKDCRVLELPYGTNSQKSMVLLLPVEKDGLKALEDSLSPEALQQRLAVTHAQKVKVFLPKFKLTSKFELAPTLSKMGMTDAFTPQADFSGMDGARDLFISDVVHKAYVDVNEEGTEAAAATGAVMALTSALRAPTPVFRADHPFIFLIRDNTTGSILFLGRVLDPTQ